VVHSRTAATGRGLPELTRPTGAETCQGPRGLAWCTERVGRSHRAPMRSQRVRWRDRWQLAGGCGAPVGAPRAPPLHDTPSSTLRRDVRHLKRGLHGRGRKLTGSDGDQGRWSGSDGRQQSVILLQLEVDKRMVRWGLNREKRKSASKEKLTKLPFSNSKNY
jgi:hypothetical protein